MSCTEDTEDVGARPACALIEVMKVMLVDRRTMTQAFSRGSSPRMPLHQCSQTCLEDPPVPDSDSVEEVGPSLAGVAAS